MEFHEIPRSASVNDDLTATDPLPTNWSLRPLTELAHLTKKPRSLDRSLVETIPFIPMAAIPDGGGGLKGWETRTSEEVRSGVYFESGDVLLAKITPCLENGKQVLAPEVPGGWGYASTEVFPLKAIGLTNEFLDLYLRVPRVRVHLASVMQGSTGRRRLPKDSLMALTVPVPPLPEQHAIAHVLRTVQRSKEQTEQVIAAAKELKRSLMRHLFTYGPVAVDSVAEVDLEDSEVGPRPSNWELRPLEDLATIERGKFSHRPRNDPDFYGGNVPFIQTGDVTASNGRISTYRQTLNEAGVSVSKVFPRGTIVITIAANIGYVGILGFDSAFPDSLIGITVGDEMGAEYLSYYLGSQQGVMDRKAPRGTQKNINIQFLRPWPTLCPPKEEQERIVEMLAVVDVKIEAEEQRRDALGLTFASLLDHLMNAKIRVTDIDVKELV